MRRLAIITATLILALASCSKPEQKAGTPQIIPQPEHLQLLEGSFRITADTPIWVDGEPEFTRTAKFLSDRFETVTGKPLPFPEEFPLSGGIYFMQADGYPAEGYLLRVESGRILIESSDGAGAFYALQTLLQLLPPECLSDEPVRGVDWTLPAVDIEDAPRFPYRGMHLDCCLHFFDVDFLKKYIDVMAFHKVNRFHWHLTEDQGWRLEIKKYPLLTEKGQWRKETVIGSLSSGVYDGTPYGGYYTQEQVRELVQYAAERYVTIIPEIELPGHALAAIACYPELSCGLEDHYETATKWGVFKQVYCPKEETFAFLEDVFDEVIDLFPSELIHIGGDECPKASWKQCPHCQALIRREGLKDEFELQSWFIQRMEKYINAKGRQIIGWDEILQGGLAPNARVEYMAWPRMCAIAESGWSRVPKDWDGFTRRLETHLGRLDRLDVGYCQAFYDPFIELRKDTEFSKVALLSVDAPDAEIRYTLDGSAPTAASPLYTGPFVINRQQRVTAAAFRDGKQIGKTKYKSF